MLEIGMNPNIVQAGGFVLSWHGLLSVVAVAMAVYLVGRWAPGHGVSADDAYNTATWAIIGGILGARVVHVVDQWDFYGSNPAHILSLWSGGMALWGAILGGFAGGWVYATLRGIPRGRLADATAPAMLLAQALGRIGDVINGEHLARPTTAPWGVVWSHPLSPSFQVYGLVPTHPAVAYELLLDLAIFAIIFWGLRGRLQPHGMLFVAYLALFSFGRFFVLFYHEYKTWFIGLNEAQVISLLVLAVTVPLLATRARMTTAPESPPQPAAAPPQPRAEGRVRRRARRG